MEDKQSDVSAPQTVFIDTETTGVTATDRVIQFGMVSIVDGRLADEIELMFNPGEVPVHPEAEKVHGISMAMLADRPAIKAHLGEILGWLQGAIVGGHNLEFDLRKLDFEMARHGLPPVSSLIAGRIDTMELAKQQFPGAKHSLDSTCSKLRISTVVRTKHSALVDAKLSALCYLQMNRQQTSMFDDSLVETEVPTVAISSLPLRVLRATPEEVMEHTRYLAAMEAEHKVRPVWLEHDREVEPDSEDEPSFSPA
jgi:DNA polymerase-3 subunit epsilon